MSRINLKDNVMDMILKMSEGNPGAMTCLMEMGTKTDWHGGINGNLLILCFDTMEIYGSDIYMLWNDCCNRDLNKLDLVLKNWQMGNLTIEEIKSNLAQGYGKPFKNLKSFEELKKGFMKK